jgi:hypothetical protein
MICDSELGQCVHFSQKKSDFDPTRKYLIFSVANLRKVAFLQPQRLGSLAGQGDTVKSRAIHGQVKPAVRCFL